VLGQLSGQKETDSSLNFATGDGRSLVVVGQTRRFGSDAFEDVVDEAVHDAHRLRRDASVRVDLLQHFIDVNGIALLPLALLLLVSFGNVLLGLTGLLGGFSTHFGRHDDCGTVYYGNSEWRQFSFALYLGRPSVRDEGKRSSSSLAMPWNYTFLEQSNYLTYHKVTSNWTYDLICY